MCSVQPTIERKGPPGRAGRASGTRTRSGDYFLAAHGLIQASICFRRRWLCRPTRVSACSRGNRNAIEKLGSTGSSFHKPLSLRLAIIARCSLDLARLVNFMSGATGATGGNSGNAEKHCSHRDQAHVLSGRKVGISEPLRTSNLALSPGVLAPPKGRMTREGATSWPVRECCRTSRATASLCF
jgi:hypothetical protein